MKPSTSTDHHIEITSTSLHYVGIGLLASQQTKQIPKAWSSLRLDCLRERQRLTRGSHFTNYSNCIPNYGISTQHASRCRQLGSEIEAKSFRRHLAVSVEEAKENKNTIGKRTNDPGGVCNCLYNSSKIWKSS